MKHGIYAGSGAGYCAIDTLRSQKQCAEDLIVGHYL